MVAAANPGKFFWLQVSMVWIGSYYRLYCFSASNGIIGCCPNEKVCYGPVSAPIIRELVHPLILICTDIYDLIASSTTTLTTLLGGLTQPVENQIIDVPVLSQIIWSKNRFLRQSYCDPLG